MRNIAEFYDNLAEQYGAHYMTSHTDSQESLDVRWKVLSEVCDLRGKSVLDVGCGYGGLGNYLKKNRIKHSGYIGVDISEKAVEVGLKEYPKMMLLHGDILENEIGFFDVVLSQGPFYLADEKYAHKLIDKMWNLANEAIAFTGISTWYDRQTQNGTIIIDDYYRIDPAKMLNYLRKYTDKIVMRHDYWKGDCCFYLYKGE